MLMDVVDALWLLYVILIYPKETSNPILPGNAIWLGDYGDGEDIPNIKDYLPILYIIIGDEGVAIPRLIIGLNETSCPKLKLVTQYINGYSNDHNKNFIIPDVTLRAKGDTLLPYAFPIQVCETILKTKQEKYLWNQNLLQFDAIIPNKNKNNNNVHIPFNPSKFILIGDTGLRSKPSNLGLGECIDGPTLYGVHQCPYNFTKKDIDESEIDGDFQNLVNWYYPLLSKLAIEENNPDVIIHVGDYLYRQGPCPDAGGSCVEINGPPNFDIDDLNGSKCCLVFYFICYSVLNFVCMDKKAILNFLPGTWGDNLYGWWADFLYPALDLFSNAPLIALRGNHEKCYRGGHGYYLFLYPGPYTENRAGDMCETYHEPYAVPFKHEQFLIMDDSAVKPLHKGVDHFNFTKGACPSPPSTSDDAYEIIPITQNRYADPNQNPSDIEEQINIYKKYFQKLEDASQSFDTNFYLGHRPVFAVACNNTDMITGDWTMQQALSRTTLDRISAMIGGHMHWLEVLTFENQSLPPQIVVGHGGTKLIPNHVNQSIFPYIKLEVGKHGNIQGKVQSGITNSSFGYGIMDRKENNNYIVRFSNLNVNSLQTEEIPYTLEIPKGPRISSSSGTNSLFHISYYFGIIICSFNVLTIIVMHFSTI